ncbi:hypothetical protein SLEP1_g25808 [Rubroshorea leprosula]|uniref:Uncharacterized protein n=1 Tax=Rubroshorea leprosula TaxID=152421 RepID=A0AAV5JUL3_9ROSI|nr:hypothetical protein SLEP1_g25808 [Rubroshorea leprosula]
MLLSPSSRRRSPFILLLLLLLPQCNKSGKRWQGSMLIILALRDSLEIEKGKTHLILAIKIRVTILVLKPQLSPLVAITWTIWLARNEVKRRGSHSPIGYNIQEGALLQPSQKRGQTRDIDHTMEFKALKINRLPQQFQAFAFHSTLFSVKETVEMKRQSTAYGLVKINSCAMLLSPSSRRRSPFILLLLLLLPQCNKSGKRWQGSMLIILALRVTILVLKPQLSPLVAITWTIWLARNEVKRRGSHSPIGYNIQEGALLQPSQKRGQTRDIDHTMEWVHEGFIEQLLTVVLSLIHWVI